MMKIFILLLLTSPILYSCATNPRVEDLSPLQRSQLNKIEIFKSDIEKPYIIVGTVTGLSCNRNKYQKQDISDHEALEGIRIKAAKLNADAVINTFCQTNSDTDWRNNCWASIKCIGDAIKYKK